MTRSRDHGWISESWWATTVPTTGPTGTTAIWQGADFGLEAIGLIEGFRVFIPSTQDGNYIGFLWDANSSETLRGFNFRIRNDSGNAWHQTWILPRIKHVDTNRHYRMAVMLARGARFSTASLLTSPVTHGNVTMINGWTSTNLTPDLVAPTLTTTAMGVDVLFHTL